MPGAYLIVESQITDPEAFEQYMAAAPAVAGFAKKNGIAVDALVQRDSPKGKVFVAQITATGNTLDAVLAGKVEEAL